jgi:hypothetical protein
MNRVSSDHSYLLQLQAKPLDLTQMSAADASRALYAFIQRHFRAGDECSLWSPEEATERGYGPFWRVSWEAGPAEWGVLLTIGESMWLTELGLSHDHKPEVLLVSGDRWYTEPYFRFDIGFIAPREE